MTLLKKIEITISNLLIKFLQNNKLQILVENKSDIFSKNNVSKILLLRHDRIGDMLISTPLLKTLKSCFPEKHFDILLGNKNIGAKDIVEPYVESIFVFDKKFSSLIKLFRKLRKQKYDLILDLFDEPSTTSSFVIKLINPLYSLGLKKEKSYVYSHLVPLLDRTINHIVLRTSMLLLPFNINPYEIDLSLGYHLSNKDIETAVNLLGDKTKPIRLGINLSGSNKGKFWGVENNIVLIKMLHKNYNDTEIVMFGTDDYSEELNQIKLETNIEIAPFVKSVEIYAAMISTCDLLITPDTAAVHFASAFRIPTIPLYSLVTDKNNRIPWTPFDTPFESVTTSSENLSEIKPEKVVQAFHKLRSKVII